MTENLYEKFSQERKEGQEKGTVPPWMSTAGYQMFVQKYLHQAEHPKEQFLRIASTAAKHAPKRKIYDEHYKEWYNLLTPEDYWQQKFFEVLWQGWVCCSTPVLANMGTNRGCPVSCAGSVVDDSIEGFYDAYREIAILTKQGFGTASDLSNIRPRGSKISVGGKASGVLPVIKHFVQDMRDVAQGTARRGAWAAYLDIEHGDFWEVVQYLEEQPDDLNIGWIITDKFIAKLKKGGKEATKRYQRALKAKMIFGKGYFFFVDKVNRQRPQMYKDLGLMVKASQLCVAPETQILTDVGYQTISDIENESVNVWNGKQWSEVVVRKTGENQRLIKVVTDCGQTLECTPYHKFYVKRGFQRNGKVIEKHACELVKGDKLVKLSTPFIEGDQTLELAYQNGFYSGDGCFENGNSRVYLYGEKRKLSWLFKDVSTNWSVQDKHDREYFNVNGLQLKFFVPDASYTIDSRLKWFAGLLDSDGCVSRCGDSQCLQIVSTQPGFLEAVQLMLQTLGVQSKVKHARDAGEYKLPANDGTGDLKMYDCKAVKRLLISGVGIVTLKSLGLETHRVQISDHVPNRNAENFVKVLEVVDEGRVDNTYCFNEPLLHMGVFNGILTGNCSEIMLHSSLDYTYTCVLSWMNLARYDEWKDTDAVFVGTVFLDCVISEFIEQASKIRGMEKAVASTVKGRAIGLGAGGFHTYLQEHMMEFGSVDAHMFNARVFKQIDEQSLEASKWLAKELGEPEWCKGYGVRFTHRMAVAPTKSTALIYGGISEGINPDVAMSFTQLTAAGEMDRVNPTLLKLIKDKGLDVEACIRDTVKSQGSVQHVDWLTDDEKRVFKTAFEINQKDIIRLAATRQKYIDQGQSTNLFFAGNADEKLISEIHQEAFENENILSLYYVYSSRGVVSSSGECVACQ
jgi:ribonucleoside-diphosphate reductase alpha chain